MARGRELSQLGSLINIEDSTKNIGVAAATPSQKVGIGTNSPTSKVEVVGDVLVSGIITATSFVGDGSGLTGLSTFSGSYNDLTDKPTIPTNNNELTNGAGYITGYTVTQSDVTSHQAALSITESQISDLGSYITASSTDTLTNKTLDTPTFTGNATFDTNTLYVDSVNNRIGVGTDAPAYQFEIENTGANALLVLDRTDGASCFIEGQETRSAFGSVNATPLALAYNSAAVVLIGAGGSITVNPDGDGFTFPTTDGSANQVLQTDGDGNISFATLSIPQSGVDFDPVGTDNSTDVTLSGSYNYLTLSSQQITLNQIDASTDISGLSTVATSGSYNDLSNTPIIPSDTGDLTNNVGFVTSSVVVGYATEGYVDNLVAISTFSGDYNDLSNQPSIPSIVGLASEGYVDVAVANLVDSAPGTLDTLNELAAALGDDANFSTTITNSLANKANLSGANFTGVVTATAFVGDGSGLIGVASTDNIVTGTAATFNNTVNINGQLEVDNINVSGISTIGGLTYPSSDGSENFVLKTDGSGNLSFASVSSLSITSFEWTLDSDLGLIEDAASESDDNGLITDGATISYDLGIIVTGGLIYPGQFVLPTFTVSTLPSANTVGEMLFVTDETGGSVPAFSDGTNWRRVTDRAIVS